MPQFFQQLIHNTARHFPENIALIYKDAQWTYSQLSNEVSQFSRALISNGIQKQSRVVVYLAKQLELITALFGTVEAGGVIVPASPQLKTAQLIHILNDCNAEYLITTSERFKQLVPALTQLGSCPKIILTNLKESDKLTIRPEPISWTELYKKNTLDESKLTDGRQTRLASAYKQSNQELAALLYTSGSTGKPKGVMLSHANLVEGAKSVSQYLNYSSDDRILAVLPLSFDYGLSQITTSFLTGASVVLMDYLLPRDVIKALEKYQVTGLAAVPPLWIQLSNLDWSESTSSRLRFITNSGGSMPPATLSALKDKLPNTEVFLMYGLTEAFRSTYLPPKEIDKRPASMGKAIPNVDVFVVRPDGSECDAFEHGELVHAGPLVSLGYWKNSAATNARFRVLPEQLTAKAVTQLTPLAVWSGDTVYKDDEGYLFFVGRTDAMIKSSGYRISPSEIEDVLMEHPDVNEVVALGVDHPQLGQAIALVLTLKQPDLDIKNIKRFCAVNLPNYMQPQHIELKTMLPKNANGKFDRSLLEKQNRSLFLEPK